jgi:RHS repeat-associated protein
MPFGEELYNGGRTVGMGYGAADGLRQKFTLKERDNETGLDYFLARYYSSTQGRFTSPDPLSAPASAHPNLPQSWNLYTYVLNNPLKLVDPDGMMWIYRYLDKEHTQIGIAWIEGNTISKADKAQGYQALNFGGDKSKDVTLTDGSVMRLSASSGNPLQLRGPQQSGSDGGYVNTGLIRELGRQTASMPAATGVFILLSLNGGYLVAGSSIAALDAAAYALYAVHAQSENDAQVMATVAQYDQTKGNPGSIRNVYTDVSKSDFIKNMEASGYKVTRSGNATILENGANRYTVYDVARSTGGPTAVRSIGGEQTLKIRLKP